MQIKQFDIEEIGYDGYQVSGYVSIYDTVDSHKDVVKKGAFDEAVSKWQSDKESNHIYLFSNHESKSLPVGKILQLTSDSVGLYMTAELTKDLEKAEEIRSDLLGGEEVGLSIGYIAKDSYTEGDIRYLESVDLVEVSLLTYKTPSNPYTFVSEQKATEDEIKLDTVEEIKAYLTVLEMINLS
tara:strand:- start:2560 stop:3108 length:549 start_codon:yes stop_codon:yes gene_type:complete